MRERILIVSASAGNGHVSAGNALLAACSTQGIAAEHVDVLDLAPRWVRTAYGGGFELLASRAPRVWREVYQWSDGPDGDVARWGPLAHRLLFRGFRDLLRSERWSSCVATHFLPGQLAAGIDGTPRFALVITDFALHRYWVQPRVREYFTATAEVAAGLRERLPGVQASASGIPLDGAFAGRIERSVARASLGIGDRRVALVMGGGLGIGVEAAVHALLGHGVPDLQVVAVCGRNDAARSRLTGLGLPDAHLRVLGYSSAMPTLMAAADVIVTKPGGLTCSEALAAGRPLVLTRAIPGHEEANVRYLTAAGAAISAQHSHEVPGAVLRALTDPTATAAAATLGRPRAAAHVIDALTHTHAHGAAA